MTAHAAPLPPAEPRAPTPVQLTGAALLGTGGFVLFSGLLLAAFTIFLGPLPFVLLVAGALLLVAGGALFKRQAWAWGLAMGIVAAGVVYAMLGLARGQTAGVVGVLVWGAIGFGLFHEDVRTWCGYT